MRRMLSGIFKSGTPGYGLLTTTARRRPVRWRGFYSVSHSRRSVNSTRQPQPECMNRNKIRKYPPMVVTLATATIMAAMAVSTMAGGAPVEAGDLQESRYEVQQVEIPKVDAMAANSPTQAETTPEPEPTYESMIASRDWDADDAERLMQIAMAEAEGESTAGKALVMLVVLNRVWSDEFPDTIEEVIFQPGQFSVTEEGGRYYTTEPDEECREALYLVNMGWDESQGALYFESCKSDSWHSRNLEYLFQEGNHRFYR